MPVFDVQITSTVIVRNVEAEDSQAAQDLITTDLGSRFPASTEIVPDTTTTVDVTP